MQKLLETTAFRSLLWRLGRKLYCKARREVVNEPHRNGEYWLLERVIRSSGSDGRCVLFDVGANKGEWTAQALQLLRGQASEIHAFEPVSTTYAFLAERFRGIGQVFAHKLAVSDEAAKTSIFIDGDYSGTNSLYGSINLTTYTKQETVRTYPLDQFVAERNIPEISMVKCDTEGHDYAVLQGAQNSLRAGRIRVLQFEYNWRWIMARHYLKDVFDFARDFPYTIGRLYGNGIELYGDWHPELERFFEGNYVLIRKGDALQALCRHLSFDDRTNVPSVTR